VRVLVVDRPAAIEGARLHLDAAGRPGRALSERGAEMEPRDWDQAATANRRCRGVARARWLLVVAVCVIVGGLLHVSVAHGMCCVCEGVTTPALNTCLHLVGDDCATCQLLCTEAGGT